jgi:hypothetical protein
LLQLERTRGATLFSLGAPVAAHGDWQLRAALNQGDLSSWVVAGSYVVRAPAAHEYTAGMSYGAQHYEGGNALALAAMPEGARNVGSIFGSDQWTISQAVKVGVHYAHHDYMDAPALFSPHVSAAVAVTPKTKLRASATRRLTAPGGEEFLPPRRAALMPPQRTFSSLTAGGFRTQTTEHYEVALERVYPAATVAARTFRQHVGNQMATLFGLDGIHGLATTGGALGHYIVATAGDLTMQGAAVAVTHPIGSHVRGRTEYSFSNAQWASSRANDAAILAAIAPALLRKPEERLHDLTTSIEAEVPVTATRVFFLYRVSNGFADQPSPTNDARVDSRFDLQVNQLLPLRNFLRARWEATVSLSNVFHEAIDSGSAYDELLVVRPPTRVVGGLTVSF